MATNERRRLARRQARTSTGRVLKIVEHPDEPEQVEAEVRQAEEQSGRLQASTTTPADALWEQQRAAAAFAERRLTEAAARLATTFQAEEQIARQQNNALPGSYPEPDITLYIRGMQLIGDTLVRLQDRPSWAGYALLVAFMLIGPEPQQNQSQGA